MYLHVALELVCLFGRVCVMSPACWFVCRFACLLVCLHHLQAVDFAPAYLGSCPLVSLPSLLLRCGCCLCLSVCLSVAACGHSLLSNGTQVITCMILTIAYAANNVRTSCGVFSLMYHIHHHSAVTLTAPVSTGLRGIAAVGMCLGTLLCGFRLVPVTGELIFCISVCLPVLLTHLSVLYSGAPRSGEYMLKTCLQLLVS